MKIFKTIGLLAMATLFAACGNTTTGTSTGNDTSKLGEISVVSREDGSGTRGAFVEIVGILTKENGKEIDKTVKTATIQNNTEGVLSTVAGDQSAIGYISLGSLKDSVKALSINGVEPSAKTVLDGTYKLQRPFNIAWKEETLSALGKDFIAFVHSKEGQDIVVANKYVQSKQDAKPYVSTHATGTLSIVGSTSVAPLIEKLAEAYKAKNPGVTVNITANGSSAGMSAAIDGTAEIGMASRELKDSEKEKLKHDAIALDGIAIVVNKANPLTSITMEQVKEVYTGKLVEWATIK